MLTAVSNRISFSWLRHYDGRPKHQWAHVMVERDLGLVDKDERAWQLWQADEFAASIDYMYSMRNHFPDVWVRRLRHADYLMSYLFHINANEGEWVRYLIATRFRRT